MSDEKMEDSLKQLGEVFLSQPNNKPDPSTYRRKHAGPSRQSEDLLFTEWEMDATIKQCRSKSTPGPDGITAPMLKNAPESARRAMLQCFNQIWDTGDFPEE
ncbi:hypothetical protein HPB47_004243 [Ixodes persulcatus]|uniref:Uncharacterized protein n=1 Tax=Ixodes persulcatus TaxID=34615 RepID=A0AC60PH63_IXOPE|nr:hypothetical protein HPB47_004243 [Ixodes persulcatus]